MRPMRRMIITPAKAQIVGFALLWLLLFAFVYFTYRTPKLPIFRDPVTQCYGLGRTC